MKQIPLTKNKFAIVDDDMFETLNQYNWFLNKDGYATRHQKKGEYSSYKKRKHIFMHTQVIGSSPLGMQVDHINRNKLDNQKENLTFKSSSDNNLNKDVKPHSSKYRGVSWNKRANKWVAGIWYNKSRHHIGFFDKEEEAAFAVDIMERSIRGISSRLNF